MTTTSSHHFTIRSRRHQAPRLDAGLYLVSTPIGNLADISLRALETLAGSSVIACEDTRTSGVLLRHYDIDRPRTSYNEHNADEKGGDLIRQMKEGAAIALISDAGTPLVSDPGGRLVQQAIAEGIRIVPVPGTSAPLAALVGSGLPHDSFIFGGFLPHKKSQVKSRLLGLMDETATMIFFESPRRLASSLEIMAEIWGGDRSAVVARELTKMHETFYRGSLEALVEEIGQLDRIRGEIVILVHGRDPKEIREELNVNELLRNALKTMKPGPAAAEVARQSGESRAELYQLALTLKNKA